MVTSMAADSLMPVHSAKQNWAAKSVHMLHITANSN